MTWLQCPYLGGSVELTDERERHIIERHPDLLPEFQKYVEDTLFNPDQIRVSKRFQNVRLFTRRFETLRDGKFVIVVVVTDSSPVERHWIITAYLARKLAGDTVEWQRD